MTVTESDLLFAADLEAMTGIPESTWRYFHHAGKGPASFKLGRRRVWRRAVVLEWLREQEAGTNESASTAAQLD